MSCSLNLLVLIYLIYITLCKNKTSETITGPSSPTEWQSWLYNITQMRKNDLNSVGYNGSIYNVPDIQWTQSSFIQPRMHGYDAYFYDGVVTHSYTYDKWLNDL
eukprot:262542_1